MFWNSFKIAFRNALKNKWISLVNILGLSVGFASTIVLISWVTQECSFDSFLKNKENIFRLNLTGGDNKQVIKVCSSPQGVGPEALAVFPEVSNYVRIREQRRLLFKVGENLFYVDKGLVADSTFFTVFSYETKIGNLSQALNRRNLVVIDESLANKCFGNANAIGKHILIDNYDYSVSAVIKNVPENSHLQFQFITPILNQPESWHNNKWGSDNCTQYLVFKNEINIAEFEHKLNKMFYDKSAVFKEFQAKLSLQPLEKIHFSSGYLLEIAVKENIQNVYILITVAFLILLIACMNFTNMFISTSLKRTRSTGVKVTAGASRIFIIMEFLIEVLVFIIISFFIAVITLKLTLPIFNYLFDIHVVIHSLSYKFLLISASLILLTLILAGIFPGFYITRFNPSMVLKSGVNVLGGKKVSLQSGLVSFQFIIAIILIISVIAIRKQVVFLKTKQLGFDTENMIYINTTGEFSNPQNIKRLKNELKKNPNIVGIASQSCLPTMIESGGYVRTKEKPDDKIHGEMINISEDYFNVMKIQFVEGGQDFSNINDSIPWCIINETAAKQLGLIPPYVGQSIFSFNDDKFLTLTGVIKDINTKSLDQSVKPCLYTKANNYYGNGIILFRLAGNYESAIADIKEYCAKNNSNFPFEYQFLDQTYDNLYKNEMRIQKLLSWFAILSIVLTAMGLLAMAFFIIESKTKEIGIRKINGARISEVSTMLYKIFLKWVTIAFVIATPIAWYAMHRWLENFAYKTKLSWWIFALAGLLALGIALLTVSWQSWRAARRNPVEALRYE
jgi:putative ABC transport system permease protein